MGDTLSSLLQSNPSPATAMSSSEAPQSKFETEPTKQEPQTPIAETPDPPKDAKTTQNETSPEKVPENSIKEGDGDDGEGEEEEEEGECGFCLFMKGGGCKDTFVEWEKCVEEGEKNKEDIVEKCFQATAALKKCMEAHSDYYAPLLQAEKAAEEEAVKQLEEEKQRSSERESEKKENEGASS